MLDIMNPPTLLNGRGFQKRIRENVLQDNNVKKKESLLAEIGTYNVQRVIQF